MNQPERPDEAAAERSHRDFTRAHIPWGYDLAAAWAWRFIVITAAGLIVLYGINFFSEILFPVAIALFIAALTAPLVNVFEDAGLPRKLAALLVVIGGLVVVGVLLTFVGQQISSGAGDLSQKVADGLGEIRNWLQTGPLHASNSQINHWIGKAQDYITKQGGDIPGKASALGLAVGRILTAFFIVLFSTYFFLADGQLIWSWLVRFFPRAARERADTSGRVAWVSLTQFVRATMMVAGTDAIGIMVIALILKVPLVSAIGVLVFIGAFVPLIGAFASGTVAVLVALVAHGPVVALIMLGGVVLVQQIEAHVLQPFLMGRLVSVHPLGVILGITAGVIAAGIPGALVAVPLVAALNAVGQHLASFTETDPEADREADREADPKADRDAEERSD